MARVEDKQAFTTRSSTYSPIREEDQQQDAGNHATHMEDEVASPSWCCCFGFGFGGGRKTNQESRSLLQQEDDNNNIDHGDYLHKESWSVNQLNKLKEFSELVAGPKWKNFIRKVGRYSKPRRFSKTAESMYSPNSYALNFDDTRLEDEEDDFRFSFSTRFSAPLSSNNDRGRPATANSL